MRTNIFGNAGATALAEALESNTKLTNLEFYDATVDLELQKRLVSY